MDNRVITLHISSLHHGPTTTVQQ